MLQFSTKKMGKIVFYFLLFVSCQTFAGSHTVVIPEVNSRAKNTGKKAATPVRMQVTQFTRQEITESPATNLSELLQQNQSIVRLTNNSGDNSQTALSIRGFGDNASANTLILVDGFPLTNQTLLAPNFNFIALNDIERIDILQGSQGSLWGNGAVGGVVNIITRHPEKFVADANVGLGSFNNQFYSGLLGNQFQNGFFFKGFGFRNLTDNYRQHNQQTSNTVFAQLGKEYTRGNTNINFQLSDNSTQFPGGLTEAQYNANPRQAVNFVNFTHYKTTTLQLLNKQEITDNWLVETRLNHRNLSGDGLVMIPFQREEWINDINPQLIGMIHRNKIIAGYWYENSYFQLDNQRVHDRVTAREQDIYGQIISPITTQFDLTLGSRFAAQTINAEKIIGESQLSSNHVWVTEQGLSYRINHAWQLFLRRDGNFSFPKANEAIWTPTGVNALQTQTGTSYETGAEWNNEKQRMQINFYQLQLQHEIAFDATQTATQPFGSFRNFDTTLRRGATFTERYQFTSKLAYDMQINYVNPRLTSGIYSGNLIPAVPTLNANAGLRYQFLPHWQAQYLAVYTGKRYASDDVANRGKMLPGYWLNSVALNYMLGSLNASVEVNNLFNQTYSAYTLYDAASHSNTYYPGAGRSYLLTIKLALD